MVATETGRVALFSIHPRYADAILAGTKEVEFRRTALPGDVTHVVVYATSPVQRIVGIFEVDGIERRSPRTAWTKFGPVGGIERQDFYRYYAGAAAAYVIKVKNAQRLSDPLALTDLDPDLRPPQSFQYLTPDMLATYQTLVRDSGRKQRVEPHRTRGSLLSRVLRPGLKADHAR